MLKLLKKRIGLIKYSDKKRLLIFSNRAINKISEVSSKITEIESGGVLLGKIYHSYDVISDIVMPCKKDKQGISFFIRSFRAANKVIKNKWERSRGKINYLGEWHTHKDISPSPSDTDKQMIKNIFLNVDLEIAQIYLFIIGTKNSNWVGRQDKKNLYKLIKVN